ncbi:hypothetical protein D9611_014224 [Ephemerocybe angulata]|uniref:Squalene monooxygenase n=1 Tax=Ephemerocybe angulata TaxID=980116 RepID=A0A8H5B7R9_9AGAR|nr:hypothetical protein D9611_014224 [Tulosesus angulatus]
MPLPSFDVVIVGAGVAGSAMAHGLATIPRFNLFRVALIERSFSQPDRIVGELLQPAGVEALQQLSMSSALDGTGAVPCAGYSIIQGDDHIQVAYPEGTEGRSFHHGRFVMGLRRVAMQNKNVTPIEANVTKLIEDPVTGRVVGVSITSKLSNEETKMDVFGDLVIVADGCFSNFRNTVLEKAAMQPKIFSYTIAAVLRDATPPLPGHGTLVLPRGLPAIAMYQLTDTETRMLIDIKEPLPEDIPDYIFNRLVPELPLSLQKPVIDAFKTDRIRKMPNRFLPAVKQGTKASKTGVILLGDSWNMRHPITGVGMSVALRDVVYLRKAFCNFESFENWEDVSSAVRKWHWDRKFHASTLNILSAGLYGILSRDDGTYKSLRKGTVKFFMNDPTGLQIKRFLEFISGWNSSPIALVGYFSSIAASTGWLTLTRPEQILERVGPDGKALVGPASLMEYPGFVVEVVLMAWTMLSVLFPVLWSEARPW